VPKHDGPEAFHGPSNVSPDGKMVSVGTPAAINLDIGDMANLKLVGRLDFSPPFAKVGSPRARSAGTDRPVTFR
jgi:hypothetical protein